MSTDKHLLHEAFERPEACCLRVTPDGFLFGVTTSQELKGRVSDITLVRKLFRDGALRCYSPDGIKARDGTYCSTCLHPQCRPHLRVRLSCGRLLFLLDLSGRSAENLLALARQAEEEGVELVDWCLRLWVVNHGHWGEVCFQRLGTIIGEA